MNWKKLFQAVQEENKTFEELHPLMKWGRKSASIIILSFFCTIYAPLFPKEGFFLTMLIHLKYAVTTSFVNFSYVSSQWYMEMGASCQLTAWVVEVLRKSGNYMYQRYDGYCISDGLSLWYKEWLTGNHRITYRVQVVVENGSYDRLSDLNCFE